MSRTKVIMSYFNPAGHVSRRRNHIRFMEEMIYAADKEHLVVETAYGSAPFEVTEKGNASHLQLRVFEDTGFIKESSLNVGTAFSLLQDQSLLIDDANIMYADSDFKSVAQPKRYFQMIDEALDHYSMVQCFENLVELGPDDQQLFGPWKGFMATWEDNGRRLPKDPNLGYPLMGELGGPGLCWAAPVSVWNKLGGLLDITPTGGDDQWQVFCALGLMGDVKEHFRGTPDHYKYLLQYQERAVAHLQKDIGFVRATVQHFYHGDKEFRYYGGRNSMLERYSFNPYTDLVRDIQGLMRLEVRSERMIGFRDELRDYMLHVRNEDMVPHRCRPNRPEYK